MDETPGLPSTDDIIARGPSRNSLADANQSYHWLLGDCPENPGKDSVQQPANLRNRRAPVENLRPSGKLQRTDVVSRLGH